MKSGKEIQRGASRTQGIIRCHNCGEKNRKIAVPSWTGIPSVSRAKSLQPSVKVKCSVRMSSKLTNARLRQDIIKKHIKL